QAEEEEEENAPFEDTNDFTPPPERDDFERPEDSDYPEDYPDDYPEGEEDWNPPRRRDRFDY
ncbi:MAG: hypothetical protein F6K03_04695, partial [Kamptonema sp. SIO4C4]|nr:hypothetical protein [Kamptonema sp. SIO4C4]